MKKHNKLLVAAAKDAGVKSGLDYAIFQNCGYKGLYGGMTAKDIKANKHLGKNDDILDYMGHEELAANLFRTTQTENSGASIFKVRKRQTRPIMKSGKKFATQSAALVAQCQKIFQHPKRASNK